MSAWRLARGDGCSFFASIRASRYWSTGFATHLRFFTLGSGGCRTGWKAQCVSRAEATRWTMESCLGTASAAGQGAPIFTQAVRSAMAFSGSLPGGGIFTLPL